MSTMFTAAMQAENGAYTWNGAESYATPDNGQMSGLIKLLFKSVRGLSSDTLHAYLVEAYAKTPIETVVAIIHIRDCRGGKGERDLGRIGLKWLLEHHQDDFQKIIKFVPEMGRYDDILYLIGQTLRGSDEERRLVTFYFQQLESDRAAMLEGRPASLAAKWAPSENGALDKKFNLVKRICATCGIDTRSYRTSYLTPLREYIGIVELLMCTGLWEDIKYKSVPSCAMRRLKKAFERHTPDEFAKYLEDLQSGATEVKAKQLFPHELVKEALKNKSDTITEHQWKVLEEEMEKLGSLKRTVCMVDSSGSMTGLPMEVAFALGILISGAVEGPFNGSVLTFDRSPKFVSIFPGTLQSRVNQLKKLPWGMNTNLESAFARILEVATKHSIPSEEMPTRLIIISDMQFDRTSTGETNFDMIESTYKRCDYVRPDIVFWNVNGASTDFPVTTTSDRTALISGFSPSVLKAVLELPVLSIENFVNATLNNARYAPVIAALVAKE